MNITLSIGIQILLTFIQPADNPTKVIDDFYHWYLKDGYNILYSPIFKESQNGMVELDFKEIDSILYEFDFSVEFVNEYKKRYKKCSTNLSTLTYEEYSNFDDIDQMDEIDCLIQSYFWFKDSMESFETYKLINTSLLSNDKLVAIVELGYKDTDEYNISLKYTLIKENDKWLINIVE